MFKKHKSMLVIRLASLSIFLFGCSTPAIANIQTVSPELSPTVSYTLTISPTPFQAITNTPMVIPPSYTPTSTFTVTPTDTPLPTDTPIPTETPVLVWNPAGDIIAPILLYHHVSNVGGGTRYYVSVDTFRAQMEALREWGYTSITISDLVDVLINGGNLPPRPVVITFDDGNIDIYQNAFPIMREMGFVGTFYIVANRLHSNYFVNVEQLQEMSNDGWEIGSHGMSHSDLTLDHSIINYEVAESRSILVDAIGQPVNTFAYPYGKTDEFVTNKVSEYGYHAGIGLGLNQEHTLGTLFYLNRREVQGDYNLSTFQSLLPWSDH